MNWTAVFDETQRICEQDPGYDGYAGREKFLAFVFTFLQQLTKDEAAYRPLLRRPAPPVLAYMPQLRELKQAFMPFADDLLYQSTNTGEVQARPLMARYYAGLMWTGFVFILHFWSGDVSANRERTDVFVEKVSHFVFDILAPGPLDSGADLVRSLIQLRNNS